MQQVKLTILKETRKQDTHSLFITPCEAWAKRVSECERLKTQINKRAKHKTRETMQSVSILFERSEKNQ